MVSDPSARRAGTVPPSLLSPALEPVWAEIRARLDRNGPDHRARIRLKAALAPEAVLALRSLLGRAGSTIDLAELEARLIGIGVGDDLDGALGALGWPPSAAAAARRSSREQARRQRQQIGQAVAGWPEPWADRWASAISASGSLAPLDDNGIEHLVTGVRRVVDAVATGFTGLALPVRDERGRASRVDVAAQVLGSSHALDSRTLVERACRRALALALGLEVGDDVGEEAGGSDLHGDPTADERPGASEAEVWDQAGIHLDRLSSPIPSWGLDLVAGSPIADLARLSTGAGVPLPLTAAALERWRPLGPNRTPVLVVENPRVVEAAADGGAPFTVVATNGNPRRNVMGLVSDLLEAGTEVYYHGDFDGAGLAICRRMLELGCRPWAMGVADYTAMCRWMTERDVALPVSLTPCGPTPWEPALQHEFNRRRLIVHEELVLTTLLSFTRPSASYP